MGFTPLDRREANLFFRLIYNQGIGEWLAIFAGDESLTTAILDRLSPELT